MTDDRDPTLPAKGPKRKADAVRGDAEGQLAPGKASPNPGGLHSANPVATSGHGDATTGSGHGRDRDPRDSKSG